MTIIAWDGKTLAADRRAMASGMIFSVTKIFKSEKGLYGFDGCYSVGLQMVKWLESGENPGDYPDGQKDNERYCHMLLITPERKILRYEREVLPIPIDLPFIASGCGRDYAMGAMACGATASEAVEIACRFDNGCGNGVDTLTFE